MWQFLFELPFRILHLIALGFDWVSGKWRDLIEEDDDAPPGRNRVRWILVLFIRTIIWSFNATIWLITVPVRGLFLSPSNRVCYFKGLPAFFGLCSLVSILVGHAYFRDRFTRRYHAQAVSSIGEKDFADGMLHAKRLVATLSTNQLRENLYLYGILNANLERKDVAEVVMATIAPDWEIGFPPAHQFRALELIQAHESNPSLEILESLQWHLRHSIFKDQEQRLLLWAQLYRARNDTAKIAETLEEAAQLNPLHYFALSELELKRENTVASRQALERAAEVFSKKVEERPADKVARIRLASAFAKLKRFDDAEKILISGPEFYRDQEIRRALAELFVLKFDAMTEKSNFLEKLSPLMQAVTLDLYSRDIYVRLEKLFSRDIDESQRKELQANFERLLVSGFNPAAAHFVIGFLASINPEDSSSATWHLAQAQSLQPAIALAYSNLASVLAQPNTGRFLEAELFARQAVAGQVQDPAIYAVLGEVLNAKGDFQATIDFLKPIALKFPDSQAVQERLTEAESALND
jgi:tetratricopeptide (TPR) repeat protein